jgi:Zn-dependent protease with chaperone function
MEYFYIVFMMLSSLVLVNWSVVGGKVIASRADDVIRTTVMLRLWAIHSKSLNGRKLKVVSIPFKDWVTVIKYDRINKKMLIIPLNDTMSAYGGGITTFIGKTDIVLVSKDYYTPETEKFVLEHELAHVRHCHVQRMYNAGLQQAVLGFEIEADNTAAKVVGLKEAYFALLEMRDHHLKTNIEDDIAVEAMQTRVLAMREKWLKSEAKLC